MEERAGNRMAHLQSKEIQVLLATTEVKKRLGGESFFP
jgi:hypothetical protein